MLGQMLRSQVSIAANHISRFPSPHLLQNLHRRSRLCMPACPRVPQIVPTKILDPGTRERLLPDPGVRTLLSGKNQRRVTSLLFPEHCSGIVVQGHRNRATRLGLIGVNPGKAPLTVNLPPLQPQHVPHAQPRCQGESHRIAVRYRNRCDQRGCLLRRNPTHAPLGFRTHAEVWRTIDPPPLALRKSQQRAQKRDVSIRCRRTLGFQQLIHPVPIDLVDVRKVLSKELNRRCIVA